MQINQAIKQVQQINSRAALMFEATMFDLAGSQIEEYNGGKWSSTKIGNVWIAVPPVKSAHVQVSSNFCDVRTDPITAGAAMTIVALNYTLNRIHERYGSPLDEIVSALVDLQYSIKDACFSSDRVNHSDLFKIID